MMLLLLGLAAGAHGLGLLSPAVLSFLDPAMPVALVAIGALIGLRARPRRPDGWRTRAADAAGALLTAALVFAAVLFLVPGWGAAEGLPYWFLALVLATCAAFFSTDDLLPVVIGGLALALLRQASPLEALLLALQACAIAVVIAAAGWLLLKESHSETEQRIFAIALLLLLGGAADYLSLSALLGGLVAGMFLDFAGGPAREAARRDLLQVQRPLLVLVLVVAGARVEVAYAWLGLAAAYLGMAMAGQSVSRWLSGRVAARPFQSADVVPLLAPGILAVAFALNVLRAAGSDAAPALAVVAFAVIGAELIAALAGRPEAAAS